MRPNIKHLAKILCFINSPGLMSIKHKFKSENMKEKQY